MKWICEVCGYVDEGDEPPEKCPVCQELVKSKQPEIAIRVIPGVREDDKGVYLVYRCMAGHTIKVYKQPE